MSAINKIVSSLLLFLLLGQIFLHANLNDEFITAAFHGHTEVFKKHLANGADVSANDSLALRAAALNGNIEIVNLLLENGADPKARGSEALAYAAINDHTETFKLLLGNGADPSTALKSVSIWNTELIKEFLGKETNPQAEGNEFFLDHSGWDREILKLVLGTGKSALEALVGAVENRYVEIFKLLLENGGDLKTQNFEVLENVIGWGRPDIVKLLLEKGADPAAQDSRALVRAVIHGNIEIVKLLLDNGADPRALDFQNLITAFTYSNRLGNTEIFKLFMQKGIDSDVALVVAATIGDIEILKVLLEAGVDPKARNSEALIAAARKRHIEIFKILLGQGADPKARDSDALVATAWSGCIEIFKMLLEGGADPKSQNSQALIAAATNGKIDIFKLLLELGANPKAQDSQALVSAAENGHIEILKMLLANGANPMAQNSQALVNAVAQGHIEIVKLLLEEGVNPDVQDFKPYIEAVKKDHKEIVHLLIQYGGDRERAQMGLEVELAIEEDNLDDLKSLFESSKVILADRRIIKKIILSENYAFVKHAFDQVPELKNAYLIGLNNFDGQWTGNVAKVLEDKIKEHSNGFIVNVSLEVAHDEEIMQHFSGFINPGNGDTYPSHGEPFTIEELDPDTMGYFEKVYQQIITIAKKYDIPYLGICAGAQHLVLNSQGSLKQGGHGGDTKVSFYPGIIPHFLLLNQEEKAQALSQCKLNKIEFSDAYTEHRFAAYIDDLGLGIKLAAIAPDGIPEAYSLGANKIGSQFHPENRYYAENYPGFNRHKQFLDNIFGIFEGYYRSMQYAKKMGIDRETAKAAMGKVNQELVDYLEACTSSGSISTHFWGNGQDIQYNDKPKRISILPGLTAEDIAISRESNNDLVVYVKDGQGRLTILDRFDASHLNQSLRLEFADGSIIDIDPANYNKAQTSVSGDRLVNNWINNCL